MEQDPTCRFYSWDHCYKVFCDARCAGSHNYDYLSLHLAFYLASWGMYRGSSQLLRKDYKIHVPAVRIVLEEFACLHGLVYTDLRKEEKEGIKEKLYVLNDKLTEYYNGITVSPTGTLISKIVLGTLGCTPAYDTFFCNAVNDDNIITELLGQGHAKLQKNKWDIDSLFLLADYYQRNSKAFEKLRKKYKVFGLYDYPQMKLLDMGVWQIGSKTKKENSI